MRSSVRGCSCPKEATMPAYRVLTGIDYPPDKRAEIGDVVSDIPEKSVKWLLDQGLIESPDKATKQETPALKEQIAEAVKEISEFDPTATDGDKDGFVQDGTPFQRPVEETE